MQSHCLYYIKSTTDVEVILLLCVAGCVQVVFGQLLKTVTLYDYERIITHPGTCLQVLLYGDWS